MKTSPSKPENSFFARAMIIAGFLLCLAQAVHAVDLSPPTNSPIYYLESWSFNDTNTWTDDYGDLPISFTNLAVSNLGDGNAVVIDTNIPAWLQYPTYVSGPFTNLTVDTGSIELWFAPDWSSTNEGGLGPQEWGRLVEVGSYTSDASYGWWSLYLDPAGANIYFGVQTNNGSTYALSAPIAWTTNRWHFIALTYSSTNTALYLDGELATNGAGLTFWPGYNVLTNGFYFGSDNTGVEQAHGMFDDIATYTGPLDAGTIEGAYDLYSIYFFLNPANFANIMSAPSTPSSIPSYDAITGAGYLQWVTNASSCSYSTNVWITNVTAKAVGSGTNITMNVTFTIEGGSDGVPYDVFATSALKSLITSAQWAWMGQAYHCNVYTITNLPSSACFLILGQAIDSDGDGLTDAYEKLVSHTDPNNTDSDGDGISDSDEVLNHTDPHTPNSAIPPSLNIQTCPQ